MIVLTVKEAAGSVFVYDTSDDGTNGGAWIIESRTYTRFHTVSDIMKYQLN